MTDESPTITEAVPVAVVQSPRRLRWVWLIPVAAVIFAVVLVILFVIERGPVITITMAHGHGLKTEDVLRCRGIVAGQVEQVRLTDDLSAVQVKVRLDPTAADVARQGSRFWVVRPQFSLTRVAGLETIAGPNYLAVLPGDGPRRKHFVALEHAPAVESIDPDGLQITLIADRRRSLRFGAPILYRQVRIGTVLKVALAGDGSAVAIEVYVQPDYVHVVRENSRFWNVSGANLDLGIKGLRFEVESLQSILDGGVAVATPDEPGPPVQSGHQFKLHPEADSDWLKWKPDLRIVHEL